jgi:hypothetical protein
MDYKVRDEEEHHLLSSCPIPKFSTMATGNEETKTRLRARGCVHGVLATNGNRAEGEEDEAEGCAVERVRDCELPPTNQHGDPPMSDSDA